MSTTRMTTTVQNLFFNLPHPLSAYRSFLTDTLIPQLMTDTPENNKIPAAKMSTLLLAAVLRLASYSP